MLVRAWGARNGGRLDNADSLVSAAFDPPVKQENAAQGIQN